MDTNQWESCIAFHGHACPGLAIGYKASLYAMDLLGITFAQNEESVCIAENDACGVDAVQMMLGCSVGKGNLLFHMTGKQAFSFYNRESGASVRLMLKPRPQGMSREETMRFILDRAPEALFEKKETIQMLPVQARLFDSYPCENCGEVTGEYWLRLQGAKKLCPDCSIQYDRFRV